MTLSNCVALGQRVTFALVLSLSGGLGDLNYPLVADLKKEICEKYGVLTGEQDSKVTVLGILAKFSCLAST